MSDNEPDQNPTVDAEPTLTARMRRHAVQLAWRQLDIDMGRGTSSAQFVLTSALRSVGATDIRLLVGWADGGQVSQPLLEPLPPPEQDILARVGMNATAILDAWAADEQGEDPLAFAVREGRRLALDEDVLLTVLGALDFALKLPPRSNEEGAQ